jgi:hypothetical protein
MATNSETIDLKKLVGAARNINGEHLENFTKRMVTGFLIHNSSIPLKGIGKLFNISSIGYLWEFIFSEHRSMRDNNEDYRNRYYALCKEMGVKNRL